MRILFLPTVAVFLSATALYAQSCDPNYALACVPIASDVDCAGGSGNGPAYVKGPVQVIGRDIYRLDRDGDGIACEPKGYKRSSVEPRAQQPLG